MRRTENRIWIASFLIAGIVILLGITANDWGTGLAKENSTDPTPVITSLLPARVPVRSPDRFVLIEGYIPGTEDMTRVWIHNDTSDYLLHPGEVYNFGTAVVVTDTLLTEATLYSVTVVISGRYGFPPQIPCDPIFCEISNSLTFTVYPVAEFYLPLVSLKP